MSYKDLIKIIKAKILKKDENDIEETKDTSELEGDNLSDFFKACFPRINKIFEQAEYKPETFDDANYVLNHLLKLDTKQEINASFAPSIVSPNEIVNVKINKNNFYIGYQTRIWKNLSIEERAQIVKWHFEYKKAQTKSEKMILRYVNIKEEAADHETMGMLCDEYNFIYINPEYLFSDYPLSIEHTLEHEFEHKKQRELVNYLEKKKKENMNFYEKFIFEKFDDEYIYINGAGRYRTYLLYAGDPREQVANIRAIKNMEKYIKDPNYQFVFTKREKDVFTRFKNKTLYESYVFTPREAKAKMNLTDKEVKEYEKDRNFIKQMPKICKLVMVRDSLYDEQEKQENEFYHCLDEIKKVEKQLKQNKDNEELLNQKSHYEQKAVNLKNSMDEIDKDIAKIDHILKKIVQDERTRIDSKMFDELNIIEE